MTADYDRDLRGYGANPPDPKWPGGARIALNFVINVEEGSEPSIQDGEGFTETQHTEAFGRPAINGRDLAGESMFEYGSRVGFWRLLRLFQERGLPLTMFACALALERNPEIANAIRESGSDICSHGWRWIKHFELSEEEEREHIRKSVISLEKTTGQRHSAGIADTVQTNTRRLLMSTVGFFTIAITTVTSCRFGRQSTATLT